MAEERLFIAFEGIDGCGKSTQARLLAENLRKEGYKVYLTFEPTDSPIGSMIRNIMKGRMSADHKTIAGLFVADRLDHLQNEVNGILKKLDEGYVVITDRYYFSSYAYHSVHMNMDWVIAANAMSAELLRPTINLFIDISPALSMERINKGRTDLELYETHEMLEAVQENYLTAFKRLQNEENIKRIDGNGSPEMIAKNIWELVAVYSNVS